MGHPKSLHKKCIAIDVALFRPSKKWLKNTEDYREVGEYWESIGGTWGGHFDDGGHFSIEHDGMK